MTPALADGAERIVVLAPHGRDAALTVDVLRRGGFDAVAVESAAEMATALRGPVAAAIVAGESLDAAAIDELGSALAGQPPWSDVPFLIFTAPDSAERTDAAALASLAPLGNVVLLDRPIRVVTLRSAVQTALRARRRQYAMRDLVARVEDGIRQRDQFLAMLGHELRNPLGAVITAAEVLSLSNQGAVAAPSLVARQAGVIRRQGAVLTRLVDDLLDVARVTSGKVPLDRRRIDLADAVRRVVDAGAQRAEHAGVEVRLTIEEEPLRVSADATRLEQIVSNLHTNAVKYTPAGGRVDVTVKAESRDAVITFRDTGVGIDADVLPTIFDLFKQAERTLARAEGGLGIGLTLVRTLVELHGGAVSARSEGLGRGSEFVVRLPLATVEDREAARDTAKRSPAAEVPRRRVFIVEDHEDNRNALVALLEQIGCSVQSAADGSEGARAIVAARPDVAIVDIGLPGMDGYAVARHVRDALQQEVVLVALTGYGQARDREMAIQAGFDVHMRKPVDVAQLRAIVVGLRGGDGVGKRS